MVEHMYLILFYSAGQRRKAVGGPVETDIVADGVTPGGLRSETSESSA